METDKRPLYIWLMVISANIAVGLKFIINQISNRDYSVLEIITNSQFLTDMCILLAISIIPILISKSNLKFKNHLGYSIPLLVLAWSVFDYFTCHGKFCQFRGILFGGVALIFALFYAMGVYLARWNTKIVISLLLIESVLVVGALGFLGYQLHLNAVSKDKLSSLQEEAQKATSPVEIGKTCDSIPDDPYNGFLDECWKRAMTMYPNVDVCSWSKETNSKNKCLFYEGLRYRENLQYGCEDNDSLTSYKKKDDPSESVRLIQCWTDKTKIYPELNICQWTYEWNRDKCTAFFKTISR